MNADAFFNLHSLTLRVQAADERMLREAEDTVVDAFAESQPATETPDITLRFREGSVSPPSSAREIHPKSEAYPALAVNGDHEYIYAHDAVHAHVVPQECRAEIRFRDADLVLSEHRLPLMYCTLAALGVLLHYQRWFGVHAACLAHEGAGILFAAPSDSGKSTLAYSMLRCGWSYISDDSVLLRRPDQPSEEAVRAFSFRRALCVDADMGTQFPELQGRAWPTMLSDSEKWRVDVAALHPQRIAQSCTPRVVIQPHIADREESRLIPTDAKSALGALITQTMLMRIPDPAVAQQQLDVLRALLQQSDLYRLETGRDVLDEPERVSQLLKAALD